jgi:ATP-grasp domain
MTSARSVASAHAAARVHIVAPDALGKTAIEALRARDIDAHVGESPDAEVIAWALDAPPTPAAAVQLAQTCARAAANRRPVCLLVPGDGATRGRTAIERAAALAHLRANGAAIAHDADAWLEAIVALVRFGLPTGPHAAVIAPKGSWLEAQALAVVAEAEATGARPPAVADDHDEPTDVVLYDPSLERTLGTVALAIPVVARGELATGAPALWGGRAALAAIATLGRAAQRIAAGLGPADQAASAELAVDADRLRRQFAKLSVGRVGDHETKVLLAGYGVPITRQAVATTPSAAVKLARRAGYPVEVKPWGHDVPHERAGSPIEKAASDALVRKAYSTVLAGAGKSLAEGAHAVIVRETPPAGREVSASLVKLGGLGWTVVLDVPGAPEIVAAPAPLRLIDAEALAAAVVASRAGDPEPDRVGLANLLRRASHLVVDEDKRLSQVDLWRIVVGGRGARTVVVDASAELIAARER